MRLLLLLLAFAMPARAERPTHIHATLVAESMTPRAGAATTLALAMRPDAGWHGYWRNPGDAGVETRAMWTLPPGAKAGPLRYPVPRTLLLAGLMNHVYESDYAELVGLDVPAGLAVGTRLPIRLALDWLACNPQMCVPERATLAIDLTIGDGRIAPDAAARFDRWRAALPRPLGGEAHYAVNGGTLRIVLPYPAAARIDTPHFFAETDGVLDYAAPQRVSRNGDMLLIETAARGRPAKPIAGVLRIGEEQGLALTATPGAVPAAGDPIGESGTAAADARVGHGGGIGAALAAFGLALLGGLILNVMPCVFPILSLKALSLARSGGAHARGEALAYTAGVVLVCLALGGLLLALRSSGQAAGWAFQLQDPRVILVLLLLVGGIALNLAGLFELPVIAAGDALAGSGGLGGAFWTGALAAFVATPCTGPFMGAALGAALVLPWFAALAVFAGLGLGLALPFLLIGFVPALRARLPRPGAWMDRLRRLLSLPMFATALGLAWVLGRQAGADGMTLGLALMMIVALSLWWVGRSQAAGHGGWWRLAPALVLAAVVIAAAPPRLATAAPQAEAGVERFDAARLATLRAEGRPVLLYFTADWCLTCKVNERTAIDRAETRAAFAQAHVATMVGDWTRGDPAITRFLAAHGRSGVPFYLFYPAHGAPRELPQLLTPGLLADLARRAG